MYNNNNASGKNTATYHLRATHMTRGVLNRYKTLADSQGLSYGVIGRMNDGEIESFLQLSKPITAPSSQRQVLDGLLHKYVSDLSHNRYLTIQALHESYKKEHPDGYGYTQFKKSIREYQYHTTSASITPIFLGKRYRLTSPAMPCGLPTRRQVS